MIQLATDPNASRLNWRPAAIEEKDTPRRVRAGHAWPFISRHGERPAAQATQKRATPVDSGS